VNIVGRRVRLIISDPWESTKIIDGKIIGIHRMEEKKSFLLVEENMTGEKYIITNRYVGDDVMKIPAVKKIIVAIDLPKNSDFAFTDPIFPSNLSYHGIGSIELLDYSEEN